MKKSFAEWFDGRFDESWFVFFGLVVAGKSESEFRKIRHLVSAEEAGLYALAFTIAKFVYEYEEKEKVTTAETVLCDDHDDMCSACVLGDEGGCASPADCELIEWASKKYAKLHEDWRRHVALRNVPPLKVGKDGEVAGGF